MKASVSRVAESMDLLQDYSTGAHPGHGPGSFLGPGPEYEGMEYDGTRWRMKAIGKLGSCDGGSCKGEALLALSEEDRQLAVRFEGEGGLALCLSRAFRLPDQLREEARRLSEDSSREFRDLELTDMPESWECEEVEEALAAARAASDAGAGPGERIDALLWAADVAEEHEALCRNTWSDAEYLEGGEGNAELVSRLEMQFAGQLAGTVQENMQDSTAPDSSAGDGHGGHGSGGKDGVFDVVLQGCAVATELARRLPEEDLTATLSRPRNLGVALDLIGSYCKNYEIDKADLVLQRILPLCRDRGGAWLMKALDKLSLVRMKQNRADDALAALEELELLVPFGPEEGWEYYDMLYRNFAWVYASLDETKKCLEYTRKAVEVKRANAIPASWYDCWDLGKVHARLGQQDNRREEMRIGLDLCRRAAKIHRTASHACEDPLERR